MTDARSPVAEGPATEEKMAETAAPSPAPSPAPASPATPVGSGWRPQPPSRNVIIIIALLAVAGVCAVLAAWRLPPFATSYQSTDNAYVRGRTTVISPQVSGYVTQVLVRDFADVKQGDPLVKIDDRIYRQRLDQARAQLAAQKAALANNPQSEASAEATVAQNQAAVANAKAQADRAAADLRRVEELAADGSLSARERDSARAARALTSSGTAQASAALEISRQTLRSVGVNRGALQAAVANAEAAVQLAEIDLSNTRILAPRDGQLGQVTVRQGAFVNAGAQLTALVPNQMWIIANLKETQMANIRIGQPVRFTVDALNNALLHGHVERISPAAGSEFSVITADNATGNYVKIAQRIPVRISIDPNQELAKRLRPGMSVVVSIDSKVAGAIR